MGFLKFCPIMPGGTMMRWNSDKGFGFIKPSDGGDDLFCHVSDLIDGEGSVYEGDKVRYKVKFDERNAKIVRQWLRSLVEAEAEAEEVGIAVVPVTEEVIATEAAVLTGAATVMAGVEAKAAVNLVIGTVPIAMQAFSLPNLSASNVESQNHAMVVVVAVIGT